MYTNECNYGRGREGTRLFDHRHCWTDGRTGVNVSCVARVTSIRHRSRRRRSRSFFLSIFYRGTKHWRFRWRLRLRSVAVARALCKLLDEHDSRECRRRRLSLYLHFIHSARLLSSPIAHVRWNPFEKRRNWGGPGGRGAIRCRNPSQNREIA